MTKYLYLFIGCLWMTSASAQEVDYGADRANKKTIAADKMTGARTDYDYLALKDHPSKSGVPLGGIGAGNV